MRVAPFSVLSRAARRRRAARATSLAVDGLSDHLRGDIGLPPRDPLSRALDRLRFGLPI